MNTINLLSLLKPTVLFVFNLKRLIYLLTVPLLFLTVVVMALHRFPVISLAETAQLQIEVNFYMLFLIVFSFAFFVLSIMLRVQQILFFEKNEERKFFFPKPGKSFFQYVSVSFLALIFSLALSALLTFIVLAVIRHFLPLINQSPLLFWGGTVLFCPYFYVRFILKLPAVAAGQRLGWWEAWMTTRRINVMVAVLFSMFLFAPMLLMATVYTGVLSFAGREAAEFFVGSFGIVFALLIAAVCVSAYSGYLFSFVCLKK